MSLFGDLPAPSKRAAEGEGDDELRAAAKAARLGVPGAPAAAAGVPPLPSEPSAADLEDLEELEEGVGEGAYEDAAAARSGGMRHPQASEDEDGVPPPPPPPPAAAGAAAPSTGSGAAGGDDQVAAALRRIASHIGSSKKFAKASQLLRELLSQDAVRQQHGPLLFSALKAAMRDPGQAAEPLLAREYSKLFTAASKVAEVFTTREKNQLDVYGTWAVLRNQLNTDDSFQFNKVVGRLKEMVEGLPEAQEGDEEVVRQLAAAAAAGAPDPVLTAYDARQQQQQQQGAPEPAPAPAPAAAAATTAGAAEADAEADPFGLDALLAQQEAEEAAARRQQEERERQQRQQQAAAAPKSATWSSAEVVCQRRAALLDCLDTAKACYRHAWARTSVDLLIEHCHKHKHRFAPSQAQRIDSLMGFVRDQRRIRKLGPSSKEVNRDTTAFERARAEWGRAAVSHRGKIGGGGDRQAEQWLG